MQDVRYLLIKVYIWHLFYVKFIIVENSKEQ